MSGLIIVGVGPGLGASVARRFAAEGFGVGLVAGKASTLPEVADTLARFDVPIAAWPADAGRPDRLERALGACWWGAGTVDWEVSHRMVLPRTPVAR